MSEIEAVEETKDTDANAAASAPPVATSEAASISTSVATYGAIDLGTSSCRLLVAEPKGPIADAPGKYEAFRVVTSYAKNVRLGEGVTQNGALCEAAKERAMEALRQIDQRLKRYGVTRLRAVATAACRRASNSLAFLESVQQELGFKIDIIDPQEEARLVLAGCTPLLDEGCPYGLVFDIGGGSTQIIWLKREEKPCSIDGAIEGAFARPPEVSVIATHSVPNGVVSLTEKYGTKLCDPYVFDECVAQISASIEGFCKTHGVKDAVQAGQVQMIGASGTVTTLAGIEMGLKRYIRSEVDGATLNFQRILCLTGFLRDLNAEELSAQPCVGEDRAELMRAGCAILEALCSHWPVGRLRVADRGLREGILLELMRQDGVLSD